MTPLESRVHRRVMLGFVHDGFPPTAADIGAAVDASPEEVADALRRLEGNHGLVLSPGTLDVWLAHPFSATPTGVWVAGETRGWWTPCLWCAFGVVALAAPDATIHCRLGGELTPIAIHVRDGRAVDERLVVHFAVPPRDAWNNVVAHCALVQPFARADDVDAWCQRHRVARGAVVPLAAVEELGRVWYQRHLDEDWVKWSTAEAQSIFELLGLSGDHWRLPITTERF